MRQLTIGRLIALLTGTTVVVLLTIDTTMACRFFSRRHYSFHCAPAVSYHHVYGPAHCETIVSGPVIYGHPRYDHGCAPPVYSSGYSSGGYIQRAPAEGAVISPPSRPGPPPIVPEAAAESGTSEVPRTPVAPPAELDEQERVEPAIVEEPTDAEPLPDDDLPPEEVPDELPDELPAEDQDEDLFDETPATDDSLDDLFGDPAAETTQPPTTPPADEMPADDLDLFNEPATETPADSATESPADDLFGAPADDATTQPAPLQDDATLPPEQPLPSETPSDAAPADTDEGADLDDLFGTSQNSSQQPDTAAADEQPVVDDLFDEPTPAADEATPATDDLFPEPAGSSAQPQESSGDDLDDLFSAKPAPVTPDPVRVTRPVAEQISELPMRQWTDNTGRFHTVGRLVKVTDTHVRLLKDNDRYTTVPKYRLSTADLEYVQEVTRELGVETFDQVARR